MTAVLVSPPRWMRWIATWFGCGYARKAPGTVGSLGALPLFALLSCAPIVSGSAWSRCIGPLYYWGPVIALALLGTVCAHRVARADQASDPQHVVIDEVVGVLIAMGMVQFLHPASWAVAWLLFRLFDIWKPWPLSAAEHAKPIGLGIMLDDLLAGVVAGALTFFLFSQL